MSVVTHLSERILLKFVKNGQDVQGDSEDAEEAEKEIWGSIKPLAPVSDHTLTPADGMARAPTNDLWRERYLITVRRQPFPAPVDKIIWRGLTLTPLTSPMPSQRIGYVCFQALVLQHMPATL